MVESKKKDTTEHAANVKTKKISAECYLFKLLAPSVRQHAPVVLNSVPQTWLPPALGSLKINTDATWNSESLCCGLAALLRDSLGTFLNGVVSVGKATSAEAAEAQAVLLGLNLAKTESILSFSLEADCLPLISALKSSLGSVSWSTLSWFQQIKSLADSFSSVNWSWISREANVAADVAAHLAPRLEPVLDWFLNPPPSLHHVLQSDAVAAPP
ncbi:uncharacterized protein LOC112170941 [Rosa chinensis]|uniref:uncharacterized protein LOC112170941 n=1 Tax=Rosa chinensis TaxID=74649 RepID=UPI000D08C562|nr:uncharacterized protein LOC112170941 [Rosa chinensis]